MFVIDEVCRTIKIEMKLYAFMRSFLNAAFAINFCFHFQVLFLPIVLYVPALAFNQGMCGAHMKRKIFLVNTQYNLQY